MQVYVHANYNLSVLLHIGENYKTEGYVINVPPEETPGGDRGSGDHMVPP